MINLVIIFIMFGIIAFFVVQPLFINQKIHLIDKEAQKNSLEQRKKILYQQIKELEMDYKMGNHDQTDFEKQRTELKQEVSNLIQLLKNL